MTGTAKRGWAAAVVAGALALVGATAASAYGPADSHEPSDPISCLTGGGGAACLGDGGGSQPPGGGAPVGTVPAQDDPISCLAEGGGAACLGGGDGGSQPPGGGSGAGSGDGGYDPSARSGR